MEDKAEDYDFDYYSLTQEMRRAFSTTGSDLMKVKELMERKQGPHETFSDYVSDMHNLHFKLKHKIAEDEFVELLKDNMNSQMGGLLLTSPITSLAELKREGFTVDRWLRNTGRNMRSRAAVNEIEEFQTLEDLPDAVTVEEFNRQRKIREGVTRMDKDAEAHYTCWCVISVEKKQISTGSILRRKNPAQSNSTMPPAGSARKSGRMPMLTQRLLRGVRQARPG